MLINGRDVITMSDGETARFRFQNLGYVFQYYNLLKTHTIYENIALLLSLNHVYEKENEQKVNEMAEALGSVPCLTDILVNVPVDRELPSTWR